MIIAQAPDSGKRHGANKSRNDIVDEAGIFDQSQFNLPKHHPFRDSEQLKFRSERSSSPSCTHAARGTGRFVQGLIELWHGILDRRTFIILIRNTATSLSPFARKLNILSREIPLPSYRLIRELVQMRSSDVTWHR